MFRDWRGLHSGHMLHRSYRLKGGYPHIPQQLRQRRSSHLSRVKSSGGALAIIEARTSMALFTAVPIAPEELSTWDNAGDTFSRKSTAPSAARTGSLRAVFFISATASFTRISAGCERHPKAFRRKRVAKFHL